MANYRNYNFIPMETLRNIRKAIIYRKSLIGKAPLCNCRRDRGPIFFGYSFVLCWRCTSILIPLIGMRVFFEDSPAFIEMVSETRMPLLLISTALILPTLIDGIRQYGFGRESTNRRRIITGFMAGFGLFLFKMLI